MTPSTGGVPLSDTRTAAHAWTPSRAPRQPVAERACCCPARAAYQVLMPPTADRPSVELLLCGHHYRASAQAFRDAGAWVFDASGQLMATP